MMRHSAYIYYYLLSLFREPKFVFYRVIIISFYTNKSRSVFSYRISENRNAIDYIDGIAM